MSQRIGLQHGGSRTTTNGADQLDLVTSRCEKLAQSINPNRASGKWPWVLAASDVPLLFAVFFFVLGSGLTSGIPLVPHGIVGATFCTFTSLGTLALAGRYSLQRVGKPLTWGLTAGYFLAVLPLALSAVGVVTGAGISVLMYFAQAAVLSTAGLVVRHISQQRARHHASVPVILADSAECLKERKETFGQSEQSEIVATVPLDDNHKPAEARGDLLDALDRYSEPGGCLVLNPLLIEQRFFDRLVFECDSRHMDIRLVFPSPFLPEMSLSSQRADGLAVLRVTDPPLDELRNRILKRLVDIVGAVLGLIVGGPVALVGAFLVQLESPGPLLYRQERCGRHGETFSLLKIRTMVPDAEKETGPVWATEQDPRKTKVGEFLRKHAIDEIPQFWNILRGDMSLVGPRPERPHFVEQFRSRLQQYMHRHRIRPGLTGWAQVNGLRGNTSIHKRLRYDLHYLANWSLGLDIRIMAMTIQTLFNGESAC